MGPLTPDALPEQRPAQPQLPPDALDFLRAVSQRQVVSRAQSGLLAQDRLYPVVFEVLKSAAPAPAAATAPSYSGALDYYASARSASARRSLSNKTSAPDLSQRAHTAAVAGGHRRLLTGGLMFDSASELLTDPFGDDIGAEGPLDGGLQFLFEPAAAGGPVLPLFTPALDELYALPQAAASWASLASARSRTSVRSRRGSGFFRSSTQRSGALLSGASTPPLSRQTSLGVAPSPGCASGPASGYASASASGPASPGYATSVVSLASLAPAAPSLASLAPALTRSHRTAQRLQPTWDAAIADRVAADVRGCLADGAIAPGDVGEVTAVASRSLARVAACALTAPAPLRPNASAGSLIRPPSWAGSSDTALREQVAHAVTDAPAAYLRAALDAVRARRAALQRAELALAQRLVFRYAPGAAVVGGDGMQDLFGPVSHSSRSSVRPQSSGTSVSPHSAGDASEAQPRTIGANNALQLRAPVLPSFDMPPFDDSALLGTLSVDPTTRASEETSSASANEPSLSAKDSALSPESATSIGLAPTDANYRSPSSPSSALSLGGSSLSPGGSALIPGAFPGSSSSGRLSHSSGTLASPGSNTISLGASPLSPGAETSSPKLLSLPSGSSGTRSRPSPRPLSEHVDITEPFGSEAFATEVTNRSLDRSGETNASGVDTNAASYATLSTSATIASTATTLSARSSVKTNATTVSTDNTQLKTSDDEAFQYSTPVGQPSTPTEGADGDTTQSTITHSTITQSNTTQSTPTPTTFKVSPQKQTTPPPQQRKKKIGLARFFMWIVAIRQGKKSAAASAASAPSYATTVPAVRDPVASAKSTIRERAPEPKGTEHTGAESRGRAKGKEAQRPFSQSLGPSVSGKDDSSFGLTSKRASMASGFDLAPSFMPDRQSAPPEALFSDDDPALAEVIETYPPNTVPALVRKHVLAYYVKASREAQGASQSQQALNGARAMLLSGPATSTSTSTSTAAAGDLHVLTPDETRLVFEQALSLFQCVLLNSCAAHNARVHAARGDGSRHRLSSASVIAEEPQFVQLPDSLWKVDVARLATVFAVDDGASYCLPEMIDQVKKRKIKEARFYASRARPQKYRRSRVSLGPAASRSSRSARPLARIPSERLANGPSNHPHPPQEQEAS